MSEGSAYTTCSATLNNIHKTLTAIASNVLCDPWQLLPSGKYCASFSVLFSYVRHTHYPDYQEKCNDIVERVIIVFLSCKRYKCQSKIQIQMSKQNSNGSGDYHNAKSDG